MLVLHLKGSSVNHAVYLDCGFMATCEPQKKYQYYSILTGIVGFFQNTSITGILKNVFIIDLIPWSTTNTGIPPSPTRVQKYLYLKIVISKISHVE